MLGAPGSGVIEAGPAKRQDFCFSDGWLFRFVLLRGAAADPLAKDEWLKVPTWVRRGFQPALMICWAVVAAASLLNIFTGRPSGASYHVLVVGSGSGFLALLYALEAMFFAYGDLKASRDEGTEHHGQEPPTLS